MAHGLSRERAPLAARCLALLLTAGLAGCGDNASPTSPSVAPEQPAGTAPATSGIAPTHIPALGAGGAARRLTACALRQAVRAPTDSIVASIGALDLAPRTSPVAPPRLVLKISPWPGDSLVPACPEPVRLLRKPRLAPKAGGRRRE